MHVGVIGVGAMGQNHARVYAELKTVDSLYLYDIDQKRAEDFARRYDATACRSLGQLLSRADAVSICVPTPRHYDVAEQAIRYGVPFLIEKPFCSTVEESRELLEQIPDDLVVGVGHIERFNPIVEEIRKIIRKPLYVEMKRHNPGSARVNGSSVVEDLMIHDIDIIRHVLLFDSFTLTSTGNEDICSALLIFDATPVYLSASRKSAKKVRMIYIEEEDITIEGDFMNQEVFLHRKPGQYAIDNERYIQENVIEKVLVNKQEPLKLELSRFLDCVKREVSFPITPAQALDNLEICERIAACFSGRGIV